MSLPAPFVAPCGGLNLRIVSSGEVAIPFLLQVNLAPYCIQVWEENPPPPPLQLTGKPIRQSYLNPACDGRR